MLVFKSMRWVLDWKTMLQGIRRGFVRTTVIGKSVCPLDRVQRQFRGGQSVRPVVWEAKPQFCSSKPIMSGPKSDREM